VIATRFAYAAPGDPDEVVRLLASDPEGSRLLGGGTWVVPDMNRGLLRPRQVIDLRSVGLDEIRVEGQSVVVGAMCTYAQLAKSAAIAEHTPVLALMAAGITGGAQITGQGTVGGSAVAARPQSDVPAVLVALRGRAVVAGVRGERHVDAADLFAGPMQSALGRDELLVRFEIPAHRGADVGYVKLKRGGSSWPIATAAVIATRDATGRCTSVALTLGGVAAVPVDVDLSQTLIGQQPNDAGLDVAATQAAAQVSDPWGDVLAPADYRLAVSAPIARRALAMAFSSPPATEV
jgi:aerobic carbon-monoxide dehydrogenase medium subunit